MLFRPLTKRYLFKIPIPLTPGIIPRQREDLAKSIGRMVSQELITEEALLLHISSPDFNNSVKKAIGEYITSILEIEIHSMFRDRQKAADKKNNILSSTLKDIVLENTFSESVSRLVNGIIQAIDIQIPIRNVSSILGILVSDEQKVEETISGILTKASKQNLSLDSLLNDNLLNALEDMICQELPFIGEKVVEFLKRPEIQKEMEMRGIHFLRVVFDKFNGIQRFFITAGQYDITLEENMGEIINDLTMHIQSMFKDKEKTRDIAHMIRNAIEDKKSIALGEFLSEEKVRSVSKLVTQIISKIPVDDIRSAIDENDTIIHSQSITKHIKTNQIETLIRKIVDIWIGHEQSASKFNVSFSSSSFSSAVEAEKIGSYIPLSKEGSERIAAYLTGQILELVEQKSKSIIEALDVYSLVVRKINSLDIASVERLLLQVIEKHLKWINLFGAILGALIGGLQVLLNMLGI